MSERIPSAAIRNLRVMLVMAILAPAAAAARRADAPLDPKAPSAKPKVQRPARPALNNPGRAAHRNPASFTPQMPFGEAIDILRNCTTPPLNIVVLWRDIGENAGIYRDTPIGIDGIGGLRIGQYLDSLLLSLSAGAPVQLGYAVHKGVITVGTKDALPAPRKTTRVYDVSDLVAEPARYFFPPAGYGGMGYGGMYGGMGYGGTGYGGMYGGQMMGPGGYGGFGAGYGPGTPYAPGGSYGYRGTRGLSNFIGGLYGPTGGRPIYGR